MDKPVFIMMCGLVASGKSCKAKELAKDYDATIFSSDDLREELFGDVNNQEHNQEVFTELHRRMKECLRNGKSAIYDACNISYKRRMGFIQELKNIPCEKICVLMATPYKECLRRNAERERKVPEYVIKHMFFNFNISYWYEGWDDIQIEYGNFRGYYGKPVDFYNMYKNYDQRSSHHSLTLGEHCRKTAMLVYEIASVNVFCAAYIHDCGKLDVGRFVDSKGQPTIERHYYNHQYTSGYRALLFDYSDQLDIAILVMWHMQPYFWERDDNEKLHNKYRKLWGEDLYQDIMKIHEADKAAK